MKTVAIVGSHPKTKDLAPWEREEVPIWVFNEAASIGWPKRVNAVFQMHDRAVWMNPNNRNDGRYPEWMRQDHPYPIYMQRRDELVPASAEYPLKAVCRALLGKVWKGKPSKNPNVHSPFTEKGKTVQFFTSTVAYAMALAIYQGFERIEIYGVEMESDTEYTYQREGVLFWMGLAAGKGVEVVVQPSSSFFREPLYGYEGDVTLRGEHLDKRIETLKPLVIQKRSELEAASRMKEALFDEMLDDTGGEPVLAEAAQTRKFFAVVKAEAQATLELGALEGALAEAERYKGKLTAMKAISGESFLARQEFEITASNASRMHKKAQAHMHIEGGEASAAWKQLEETGGTKAMEVYQQAHKDYLTAASECGRIAGALNENVTLLGMTDTLIKAAGGMKAEEAMIAAIDPHPTLSLTGRGKREIEDERVVAEISA